MQWIGEGYCYLDLLRDPRLSIAPAMMQAVLLHANGAECVKECHNLFTQSSVVDHGTNDSDDESQNSDG